MEEDDNDSTVSSNCSSAESSPVVSLTEDEIEKLLKLFKKDINRNYGIFISLNARKSKKSKNKAQTISNENCHINQQNNNNINLTVNNPNLKKEKHGIPFDIPRYTNQYFGRQNELEKLNKIVQKNNIAIVTGIEGIGKTEFTKKYIETFHEKFDTVEWINGSTKDKFNQSLTYIASKYHLSEGTKDFIQYFQKKTALFVIDSAYDKIQFRHFFPRSGNVTVVISTEYTDFNNKKWLFELPPITDDEAIDVFQSIFEEKVEQNEDDWINLARYFDNIPLALQLISACLHEEMLQNKCLTVEVYLNDIQKKMQIEMGDTIEEKYQKIYFSLKLSIETITMYETEANIALEILNICVYLDDNHISKQVLLHHQSIKESVDKLDEVLNILQKYKCITIVIKQNHNEIHIHNCIRRMLLIQQKDNGTSYTYFKMAVGLLPSLGACNIKYLLNQVGDFTKILVEYIISHNMFNILDVIVENGHDSILYHILQAISNPETVIEQYNLMEMAIQFEQITIIKVLMKYKTNVNELSSALHQAAKKCSLAIIVCFLQTGIDPNLADYKNNTPLHSIISLGYTQTQNEEISIQCIRALLKNGANINAKNIEGNTALHLALENKAFKIALFLLNQVQVNTETYNLKNETPIQIIFNWNISNDKEELLAFKIIKILLLKGAKKTTTDIEGRSLLIWAIDNKCQKIIDFLLNDCSLNVNHQDMNGQTAFHKILNQEITNKKEAQLIVAIVRLLLDAKAKTDVLDNEGNTALDLSQNHGNVKLCLFIQYLNYELIDKKKKNYYFPDKQISRPEKRSTSSNRPPFWESNRKPDTTNWTPSHLNYASGFHLAQAASWSPQVPSASLPAPSYCNHLLN